MSLTDLLLSSGARVGVTSAFLYMSPRVVLDVLSPSGGTVKVFPDTTSDTGALAIV
jgi:hypothetical protein